MTNFKIGHLIGLLFWSFCWCEHCYY